MMKLNFHGAAGTVTGSCYELITPDLRLLIDCGMFQGEAEEMNNEEFDFDPSGLDYVLLTHAHVDHSGLLPKLVKEGFAGTILCSHATKDLCSILLPDSGHIQEEEAERRTRKGRRSGKGTHKPIYTESEARETMTYFRGVDYDKEIELSDSTLVSFRDAGHILGSSFLELIVSEGSDTTRLTFSGDLGNPGQPIIRDPSSPSPADVVLMESTYGDRLHENISLRSSHLADIVNSTLERNGNIIIPSFAVGRTQDILYELVGLQRKENIPHIPIYVDSPLATSASNVYRSHPECFDPETVNLLNSLPDLFDNHLVHFIRDVAESKALNAATRSIIIASSGMCEFGRILHHLKHNLWRPECTVLFVGYQAPGTLGRRLLSKERFVEILGEVIAVKAKIEQVESFSAHADQAGLLNWLSRISSISKLFLVHGEEDSLSALAKLAETDLNISVEIPKIGSHALINGKEVQIDSTKSRGLPSRNVDELKLLSSRMTNLTNHIDTKHVSKDALEEVDSLISDIKGLNKKLALLVDEWR